MPRKKTNTADAAPVTMPPIDSPIESQQPEADATATAVATVEPTNDRPNDTIADGRADGPADGPTDGTGKNYGPPYRAVLVTPAFEMGENRRYKQRVFMFKQKPDEQTLALLKENGFTYRPAEKSWTINATAESRVMTDRLARVFAGESQSVGR